MGIGRVAGRAALDTIRASTNRAQMRSQVADCINLLNDWMARRDTQDATAEKGFAESRPGQFNSFVDTLPEVSADPTP